MYAVSHIQHRMRLCSYNWDDLCGLVVEFVRKLFVECDYVGDVNVAVVLL